MGGHGAPDDLAAGAGTQAWLAVSDAPAAAVSGELFYHQRRAEAEPVTRDVEVQDRLLAACAKFSGVALP